ncbi:hypothetical protein BCR39DRAFT_585683 [Naematelia encephala]|uniref:Uncharacterized protein n=1 Tax=Naematelia encephala TaxID=71784 RepID=A0A1Y2BIW6_9TREE|nr:hypothetical protein BCR39DRAFT_585683 [Naematelia encephala]
MSFLSPTRHGMPTSPTPDQPGGSILLNGPGRPHSSSISSIPSTCPSVSDSAYVPGSTSGSAQYSPTASQSSLMSESALTDISATGSGTSTSTKIRFAPLPQVPPDLKRRSSITLGVLARRNMLQGQGTTGAGAGGMSGTTRVVKMTDAEWEEYKRKFDQNKSGKEAVDLGVLAKQGAKSLWRKVRSSSTSSQSSTTSSNNGPTSPSMGVVGGGPPSSPIRYLNNNGTNNNGFAGRARRGSDLAILEEEESPTSGTSSSALGLDTSKYTRARQDYGAWNPENWKPPHAHVHPQPRLLNEDSGQGQGQELDGDVTPRRRASPPPPPHPSIRQVEEEEEEEEEEEGREGQGEVEEEEDESEGVVEGRKEKEEGKEKETHPPGKFQNIIKTEGDVQAEHERDRREAVLGFDDKRYHLDAQGHWEGHLK